MKDSTDKNALPPLFRRHTRRPRLTNALDETTAQAILLNAPAGYGKTTLAQEWLQGREHVAWYRATSASADLAAFSSGLADVVAPILPGAGDRLKQRLRVGDAPDRVVRALAELMAEDLAPWPDDGMIVVDDYHLVADSSAVEEFVDWLLTLVPVRMLVTTRRRPTWASARRVLYGEVIEIGPEQLAMTDEEAAKVLGDRAEHAVHALVRQAQGWPALIGLASLSASLELPEERVSDALFRYFAEEVLRNEPPEVQRFMLLASIPATINAQIARDVLGFQEPQPLLDHLKAADILKQESRGEMRFHPLLRSFLSVRLEGHDRGTFEAVSHRLIEASRTAQNWEQAFDLATRLNAQALAAELLAAAAPSFLSEGRVETLEKWLIECAAAVEEVPGAVLARAHVLVQRGELTEGATIARGLAESLPDEHSDAPDAWALTGRALHLVSADSAAFECYTRAHRLARTPQQIRDALWGLFVTANEVTPDSAEHYLDELEGRSAPDIDTRLRLAVGRQAMAEQHGNLAGLWPQCEVLVPLVAQGRDPMAKSSFLANSAAVNVSRGHSELAQTLADDALRLCTDVRLDFAIGPCLAFRSAAEIGLRRFAQANQTLSQLRLSSAWREDPYFRTIDLTLRAKLALARRSPHEALETLEAARFVDAPRRALGEYLALMAVAHAAADEPGAASQHADEATRLSKSVDVTFFTSFAQVITAVRNPAGLRRTGLAERLIGLVAATADAEFLDGLVVCYRAEPAILQPLRGSAEAVRTVQLAMTMANDHDLAKQLGLKLKAKDEDLLLRSLTPREHEVLLLLAEGLSNRQIADRLFISPSTAKVHVHHILEKLGVKTRLQAVLVAQRLLEKSEH